MGVETNRRTRIFASALDNSCACACDVCIGVITCSLFSSVQGSGELDNAKMQQEQKQQILKMVINTTVTPIPSGFIENGWFEGIIFVLAWSSFLLITLKILSIWKSPKPHIYTYTFTDIFAIQLYAQIHTYPHPYIHAQTQIRFHTRPSTRAHAYMYTRTHSHINVYRHTHQLYELTHLQISAVFHEETLAM